MPIDDLVEKVRTKCCPNIINSYSTTKLWNRKTINVDNIYVDVYLLNKISSEIISTNESIMHQDLRESKNIKQGLEVSRENNRLMILGKPGSGKTTFLNHLAIACCNGTFEPKKIPILIELRSLKDANKFKIFNEIHEKIKDFKWTEETTNRLLQQGKFLILLDGLDEVPGENRKELKEQIEYFSANNSNNHFILTCRLQIPENNLKDFTDVEIADFNDEQIQKFAENWFPNKEITNKFLEKLNENERIKKLAVTPILLTLICVIFDDTNNENLPPNRSQLYQRGINLLLKEWDEKRDIQRDTVSQIYRDLSIEDKQKLLYYLANSAFNQNQYPVFEETYILKYIAEYLPKLKENILIQAIQEESKNILTDIEVQHGLLIKRAQRIDSEGIYSFSHLTFQEYFTAKYIVENNQIEQLVKEYLTHTRWREVFLLVAEISPYPEQLLKIIKEEIDYTLGNNKESQDFLSLVYEKSEFVYKKSDFLRTNYHPAKIRAFYFSINRNNLFEIQESRTMIKNEIFNLKIDFKYAADCIIDYDLALLLYNAYYISVDPPFLNRFEYYQSNHSFIQKYEVLKNYELEGEFVKELEDIKNLLPTFSLESSSLFIDWAKIQGKEWANKLRSVIVKYRNIRHSLDFWSDNQWQLIQHYYNANNLLIDCLNNSQVSPEVRKTIKDTLLLPIAKIEQHQQYNTGNWLQ